MRSARPGGRGSVTGREVRREIRTRKFRATRPSDTVRDCQCPRLRESPAMPRATELSLRLAVARMARLGAAPPEIARQLGLPASTARALARRALSAEAEDQPAAGLVP